MSSTRWSTYGLHTAALWRAILIGVVLALALPPPAHGGSLSRSILRGAMRSVSGGTRRSTVSQVLRKDLVRDRHAVVRPLRQPRSVFRYTTERQVRHELRSGIPPLRHMTSRAQPGPPLSSVRAVRRYGLPVKPAVRETIRLERGRPVRLNRVIGGEPGRGELTSPRRVPAGSIRRVVPLR